MGRLSQTVMLVIMAFLPRSSAGAAAAPLEPAPLRLWGVDCDGDTRLNGAIKAQLQQLGQRVEERPDSVQSLSCTTESCAAAWPGTQSAMALLGGSVMPLADGWRRAQLWLYKPSLPPRQRTLYREVLAPENELPVALAHAAAALVFERGGTPEPGTPPAECATTPAAGSAAPLPFKPLIHVTFYRRVSQRKTSQAVWEKLKKVIPTLGGEAQLDQVYDLPRRNYGFSRNGCDPPLGKTALKVRSEGRLLEVEFVQSSDDPTAPKAYREKLFEVLSCRVRNGHGRERPTPMAALALSPADAPARIVSELEKQVHKLLSERSRDLEDLHPGAALCQPFKPAVCTATPLADCRVDPTSPRCRDSYCPQHPEDVRCAPAATDCSKDPTAARCGDLYCQKYPDDKRCKEPTRLVCGVAGGPPCAKTTSPHVRRLWQSSGYLGAAISTVTLSLAVWQLSLHKQPLGGDTACATTDGAALVGRCVQLTQLSTGLLFGTSLAALGLALPGFITYYRNKSLPPDR